MDFFLLVNLIFLNYNPTKFHNNQAITAENFPCQMKFKKAVKTAGLQAVAAKPQDLKGGKQKTNCLPLTDNTSKHRHQ